MPRVAKPKENVPALKKKPAARKKNDHVMPEPIKEGEIVTDMTKQSWKIGPTIGKGGFGQIYSACKASSPTKKPSDYEYVIKIEPHTNGTLFVEMHFYMRNARLDDIKEFQKNRGLKSFGMPYLVGSGSHDINKQKHRFVVMPRYGSDIWKFFLENGRKIPDHTSYRLAIQMLDVYEYIHGRTYVHADLKGANILLGYGKGGGTQAYLVDFGLASHYTQKEFKPDPKKMHNGTIEYTSRDAHLGVATMRGDMEILGYNLIDWSGVMLPWEKENLLNVPLKVQKSKEAFMDDVSGSLKKIYPKGAPNPILEYLKYVATLKYNDTPDYEKCRKIFLAGLKELKVPNSGDLEFKLRSSRNFKAKLNGKDAEDMDSDEIFEKKTPVKSAKPIAKRKSASSPSPVRRGPKKLKESPDSSSYSPPSTRNSPASSSSPIPARGRKPRGISVEKTHKPSPLARSPIPARGRKPRGISEEKTHKPSPLATSSNKNTPVSAKINFSPVVTINKNMSGTPRSTRKPGKTIINDNLTPNPRSAKTYEFNFELDVSMDANVVVNVKRKKRAEDRDSESLSAKVSRASPQTRVKLRRINTDSLTPDKKASTPRSKNSK